MAVFRVERNKGYTVMSNHHLRNKELTIKAKGLLSQMLSLPEDWDYTLAGLSQINREKIDAIRFDNGASLCIGNYRTPKAKTVKVQSECVNAVLVRYNPEIVQATKEASIEALRRREAKDNEIAAEKGLKPYTFLNVELHDGADSKSSYIQRIMSYVKGHEQEFIHTATECNDQAMKKALSHQRKELEKAEARLSELNLLFRKLYEDNAVNANLKL